MADVNGGVGRWGGGGSLVGARIKDDYVVERVGLCNHGPQQLSSKTVVGCSTTSTCEDFDGQRSGDKYEKMFTCVTERRRCHD